MRLDAKKYIAWFIYAFILLSYIFSLIELILSYSNEITDWQLNEVGHIIKYSLLQSTLSASLSLIIGLLFSRALFYLNFKGKSLLYRILSFIWSLPSLVVIFAIIGVWGYSGWITQLIHYFNINFTFNLYGLQGILLTHLFLNIPFATKSCLEGLHLIPTSYFRLASQLNLTGWHYFNIVELPLLKRVIPYTYIQIFILCFTSFPIVLMLGGSPKYSTLEVAIYQAVTFEFNLTKAIVLIFIQMVISIILLTFIDKHFSHSITEKIYLELNSIASPHFGQKQNKNLFLYIIFIITTLFLFLPILNIIANALSVSNPFTRISNPQLWKAIFISLELSFVSGLIVIFIAIMVAIENRRLALKKKYYLLNIFNKIIFLPNIMPIFLLAIGLFLLFMDTELNNFHLIILISTCNALTLLVYVYRLIYPTMWQTFITQNKLAQSLGIYGFQRWWILERPYLIRPLTQAFALAMSSSLGNFAIIAFFGNPDFIPLPYLLYQQLGSYHMEDAAITTFFLTVMTFIPFLLTMVSKKYD